jgi:hypothetical protein
VAPDRICQPCLSSFLARENCTKNDEKIRQHFQRKQVGKLKKTKLQQQEQQDANFCQDFNRKNNYFGS